MIAPSRRLWDLLPGIYRARDREQPGAPMRGLTELLGSELDRLRDAIRALADDHFVERASADGVALLAELLGARLLHRDLATNRGVVFHSIGWRRRRGTQPTLEDILRVTTGWSAEVDESFRSLLHTQDLRYLVPWRGRTAVLWDPIAIADPLSRNAPVVALPPRHEPIAPALAARRADETLDEALRRLGRADAGRHAASPRTFDLTGWARPDVAVIRTARLVAIELEGVEVAAEIVVATPDPGRTLHGFHLDPLGRDVAVVWLQPLERPDTIATLTSIHEPAAEPPAPRRTAATLLTPTALAEDGDRAEAAGAIDIEIDGVQLAGPPRVAPPGGPLSFQPLGAHPVLRFADALRPDPSDAWVVKLIARQPAGDRVIAAARATRGATGALELSPKARTELGGATVAVRVRRLTGAGAVRDAGGAWTAVGDGARLGPPLGGAVAADLGGGLALVRPELHEASGALRLARANPAALAWTAVPLTGDVPDPEAGTVVVAGAPDELLLLVPVRDGGGELVAMALFRVAIAGGAGDVTRMVDADALQPPARRGGAAAVLNGRLYLHGGAIGGAPIADLWSIATDGSEPRWTPHPVRNPQPRAWASLVAADGQLWLLGGESAAGDLAPEVWSVDPTAARPRWRPRPALPLPGGAPGVARARRVAGAVEVIAWADATRPRRYALVDGDSLWSSGALEDGAPNPPAPGELVFAGDQLVVAGPPPLPASELIVSVGGASVLAHLPALDLTPAALDVGEALLADEADNPGIAASSFATYHLGTDGSTWIAGAGDEPLHARQGGALHASRAARVADRARLGIPERLARHFFVVRQRSLGVWDQPLVLDDRDVVGLDPRLGRVLLPGNVTRGRTRVSYRVGRPSAIGAGALPVRRAVPEHWHEPEHPPPTPPDLVDPPAPTAVCVDPMRAGLATAGGGEPIAIVGDLEDAADVALRRASATGGHPVIGVLRSAALPPARITGVADGLSIVATDFGATPLVRADASGASLAVHPDRGGSRATDVWLAGLWLEGRLDLAMACGEVDLRWCTLGQPGHPGVWLPGADHESPLTRRTLPAAELELRLYGCTVAALEVPPWVRVVAAGCTFDAGSRAAIAVRASGADVRLRHCTVHGELEAGELRASSCVFAGAVRVDRPDLGWVRHSLLATGGRPPRAYRSVVAAAAFASSSPTDPGYLALAANSSDAAFAAGELGRPPGAHDDRGRRLRELDVRATDFVPVGLVPYHIDRATDDLARMSRPPRRSL